MRLKVNAYTNIRSAAAPGSSAAKAMEPEHAEKAAAEKAAAEKAAAEQAAAEKKAAEKAAAEKADVIRFQCIRFQISIDRFCILLVFLQSISQFLIIFCTSSLKCSDRFHFLVHFYCLIPAFFL